MADGKRKIVQIATMPSTELCEPGLVVLCNDGTAWIMVKVKEGTEHVKWRQLKSISQDTP